MTALPTLLRRLACWLLAAWRNEFAVYSALDRDSAEMRARHLNTVTRLTPLMAVVNVANGVLVSLAYQATVPLLQRGVWLLLLTGGCALAARAGWHRRRGTQRASVRAVRRQVQAAVVLAVLWGYVAVMWFPLGDADQRVLTASLVVGMMCGGAFAMAAVPQAALGYMAVLTVAAVAALHQLPGPTMARLQVLLVLYSLVLAWCVVNTSRVFTARLVSEREAARQGQLVGLLLRDFEENAADLLWEVGANGHFTHVAPRLAQALERSVAQLQALSLLQVLADRQPLPGSHGAGGGGPGQGSGHLAALRSALAHGRAFRDLVAPVRVAGPGGAGLRWWSFTAKPLTDEAGRHTGWRGVIADVTQAREAHRKLAFLAHFDSLTGLANRVQLRERLALALADADATPPRRSALVCLDVDHFKSINDSLGHAVGDAVLVAVAQRLNSCLREADLAARLGGDEFALVIADVQDDAQLQGLARRLVATLCQPCEVDGHQVPLGVSLGLAIAPDHGRTLDELMAHADLALYAAKEAGRGRCELYVPRLGDRHRRRLALEHGLRSALVNGEMQLHWQPRISIDGWRVEAAEALLRWQHPELGPVGPAEFIPVAEDCGLITEIGAWVLAQACTEAMSLPPELVVSVNVSAAQLQRPDFIRIVEGALAASGLSPQRLEIEITESLFIDAATVALGHLHALRARGVQVALDDFGTGYSSLAYLRRFPFDTLKIDRAFVRELMTRHDARAIVRTIIDLARTLGMHTLAEGVEEPAQLEVLREAGCAAIQGYLVARPMPLQALNQLLANWTRQPAAQASASLLPGRGVVLRQVAADGG
jgi:diguanylate cyclase (GGDEF)-like protein